MIFSAAAKDGPDKKPQSKTPAKIAVRRRYCLPRSNILELNGSPFFAGDFCNISLMANDCILKVEHLSKFFKSGGETLAVLRDVSFAIEAGSTCALVGPSGSGKTTLIAICAGLERPSEGSVQFDGTALERASEEELARIRNQSIGFVFQNFQLLPSLTALENVMVPAEIRGENHTRSRALDWLKRVGLSERAHHYPVELSGGEQQRVAIARAFMNRPKILFADEPTGNLDAETAQEIVQLIFELNATSGTTLLLVTHDNDLTERAGRVIRLRGGKLVADERRAEANLTTAKTAGR